MPDSIQDLLQNATRKLSTTSSTAQLDAEVLLCHCLGKNRSYLRTWPDKQITHEQLTAYRTCIEKRRLGMPVAYLTGEREFWSRNFNVSPDVLIPRPDSELLIELSLAHIPPNLAARIIDLGTGSGILAVTLAAERPNSEVIATDISAKAIKMARQNALKFNLDNIHFIESNWFDAVTQSNFDLVISNPPYIAAEDPHLLEGDLRFEPDTALVSADNGLKDIRILVEQAALHLKNNGVLLIEHGYQQQNAVQSIFEALNYRNICTHRDLSGLPRVTSGLRNPS